MKGNIAKVFVKVILQVTLITLSLFLVWGCQSRKMGPLQIWHTVILENEFTARDATPQSTLQDYLDIEDKLFSELQEKIYERIEPSNELIYSRYQAGGVQDPAWPQQNWNRTFELVPEKIKGGALLLHGLTDSPYSLRRIGEILYNKGFYVLGMRLPGHGTIPSALTRVNWKDWVAASRIGARHVHERLSKEQPFVIAGYSNGGGLAVKYALDALNEPSLPVPDRLLLFSPEIGVNPLARIANLSELVSFLPYFAKFKWESIEPEYDPFKYNSFSMNAAREAWEVTAAIERQVKEAQDTGRFKDFPNVLTFLSWTDATVKTSATIQRLYDRLESPGSELIIFDVNRLARIDLLIPEVNESPLQKLETRSDLPYRLTVISNIDDDSSRVAQRTKAPNSDIIDSEPLEMLWPNGIYSLSHVAIPFASDDPVYGSGEDQGGIYHGLPLGALQPRGETHILTLSLSQLMRLRHNPFFAYVERRVIEEIDKTLQHDKGRNPNPN
jgi:alpha-beta hydrolase superfamily lysophospholipase